MGIIWQVSCWAAGILLATALAITIAATSLRVKPASDYETADVIIVFGAGMAGDGTLYEPSVLRVRRGVDLFKQGRAPQIHFTGGRAVAGGPAAGDQMAALAIDLGVPDAAITRETRSLSTLQNALYSMPDIKGADSAILVTEGFHLPRAAAAVVWAGGPHDLQLASSTRFREGLKPGIRMVLREALAWWFNGARAAAHGVAGWAGVAQDTRDGWLK